MDCGYEASDGGLIRFRGSESLACDGVPSLDIGLKILGNGEKILGNSVKILG